MSGRFAPIAVSEDQARGEFLRDLFDMSVKIALNDISLALVTRCTHDPQANGDVPCGSAMVEVASRICSGPPFGHTPAP